jgi:hypothetical protein
MYSTSNYFQILFKLVFSLQMLEKSSNIKFHKNPSNRRRIVTYRQTNMTQLTVAYRNLWKRVIKNECIYIHIPFTRHISVRILLNLSSYFIISYLRGNFEGAPYLCILSTPPFPYMNINLNSISFSVPKRNLYSLSWISPVLETNARTS